MDYHIVFKFILFIASLFGLRRFKKGRMKHPLTVLIADLYYNCIFVTQIVCLIFSLFLLPIMFGEWKKHFNSETPIRKVLLHSFPIGTSFIYYLIALYICLYARENLKTFERIVKKLHKGKGIWEDAYKNILYFSCCVILLTIFIYFSENIFKRIFISQDNILLQVPFALADFYADIQMLVTILIYWANIVKLTNKMKHLERKNIKILKQNNGSLCKRICHSLKIRGSHPEIKIFKVSIIRFHALTEETFFYYCKPISLYFVYCIFHFTSYVITSATQFNFNEIVPVFVLNIPCTFIVLFTSDYVKEEVSSFHYLIKLQ